jgi:hypothetical protein
MPNRLSSILLSLAIGCALTAVAEAHSAPPHARARRAPAAVRHVPPAPAPDAQAAERQREQDWIQSDPFNIQMRMGF